MAPTRRGSTSPANSMKAPPDSLASLTDPVRLPAGTDCGQGGEPSVTGAPASGTQGSPRTEPANY